MEVSSDKTVWAALMEKAWAKVKGNYLVAEVGYLGEGLNALTGLPGFGYRCTDIGTGDGKLFTADEAYALFK